MSHELPGIIGGMPSVGGVVDYENNYLSGWSVFTLLIQKNELNTQWNNAIFCESIRSECRETQKQSESDALRKLLAWEILSLWMKPKTLLLDQNFEREDLKALSLAGFYHVCRLILPTPYFVYGWIPRIHLFRCKM